MVQKQVRDSNKKNLIGSISSPQKIGKQNNNMLKAPSFDFDVVSFTNNHSMFATSRQRRAPVQAYEQVLILQPQTLISSHELEMPRKKQKKHRVTGSKIFETTLPEDLHPPQTRVTTTSIASSCNCSTSSSLNVSMQTPSSPDQFMIGYNNQQLNTSTKSSSSSSRIHRSSISIIELLN